tara:strand:+ start:960 stop:1178 length:219 start_codon:yes stop_codon:yes gene_type:complete
MKQDDQQARLIDLQEREKKFDEEFDRKMTNTISEQKGKKALKKLQKQEVSLDEDENTRDEVHEMATNGYIHY